MRRKRFLGFLPALCLLALPLTTAFGANELKLEKVRAEFGDTAEVKLLLNADDQIQGVVVVAEWSTAEGVQGLDLVPVGPLADTSAESDADTVVARLEDGYMVLGVVMDSNPSDNGGLAEVIDPGADIELAVLTLKAADQPDPIVEIVTPLMFVDAAYNTVDGGPLLDNIVVVGGLSQGEVEGLVLTDGELTSTPAPDKLYTVDPNPGFPTDPPSPAPNPGDIVAVNVMMDAISGEVEGFVAALCYDPAQMAYVAPASGDNMDLRGADADADFVAVEEGANGVAIGVVIDLIDPMAVPPNIPQQKGNHVLTLNFQALMAPPPGSGECVSYPLAFCDLEIGDPLKENLIVVGGLSITAPVLALEGGDVTFCASTECVREVGPLCEDQKDNDCDGLIDMDDPDCQRFDFAFGVIERLDDRNFVIVPECAEGAIGGVACSMLWMNPLDLVPPAGADPVQGFSLVLQYDCDAVEPINDLDVTGTILEQVGAEFVGISHGSEMIGEDTVCSMVIGVLVDALPPFDGQVIPGLPEPQAIGKLCFRVLAGVDCDATIVVTQAEGLKGGGKVPNFNLASVDNYAYPVSVGPLSICSTLEPRFFRGDCNFSDRFTLPDPVEVADAAAVISFLFGPVGLSFDPPCLDACDANDDARIDLGDAVAILYFLFIPCTDILPEPWPGFDPEAFPDIIRIGPGEDPTPDALGCEAGVDCAFQ